MILGVIKERKFPPDRRVVFSPEALVELKSRFPETRIIVESSDIRVFPDRAYREKGILVSKDLSECQVLLGVKEVPVEALLPGKKYFFFSHTVKKQAYNRDLLRAVLDKEITLYDHETITDSNGNRLVAFGYYAGIVGAYNGFRAYGKREKTFDLPKVEHLPDFYAVRESLKRVRLPKQFKILLTGGGKVAAGARKILDQLSIKKVSVEEYLTREFREPVFCQIDVLQYNKRRDGKQLDMQDFFDHPESYQSDFKRFSTVTDYYIAGHYYDQRAPYLFTKEDTRQDNFKIHLIADISCDIDGPVASTIRPSTIADPFYGYDPTSGWEVRFDAPNAITVMAVDNLPCELPKDASEGFGRMFLQNVVPALFNGDKDGILQRAKITEKGELTARFSYLQDFVEGKE